MMKETLIETVKNTIQNHHMISTGDAILVAVSGGADSVCLLDILCRLKEQFSLTLYVAHLNHMLRGDEADRDENFVRNLCEQYNLPFFSAHINISEIAKTNKISIEEAGRNARYNYFYDLKQKYAIDKIATAHNKNDNAETVCMRFMRGTGLSGLSGIPPVNDRSVIRPLLFVTRKEIEQYLNTCGLAYVTDSSNLTDAYTRNHIRNDLIPQIVNNYNPNFIETLDDNITLYRETNAFLKKQIDKNFSRLAHKTHYGFYMDCFLLLAEDIYMVKSLIKKAIFDVSGKNLSHKTIQLLVNMLTEKENLSYPLDNYVTVYKKYNRVFFVKQEKMHFCYKKENPENVYIAETGHTLTFFEGEGNVSHSDKYTFYLKKSLCENATFTVRNRLPGDCIDLGKGGRKKIQNLFVDEKIPSFLRDEIPLVLLNDAIIWICGLRDNPKFRAKENEAYVKISYAHNVEKI